MAAYQGIFKRVEKKYRLDAGQYRRLLARIGEFVQPDRFAESLIGNIYYDTPDSRLIRTSLEKPVYKEKLRLRCYGVPADDTPVLAELKKKYKGVVYKRRVRMPLNIAAAYLTGRCPPPDPGQITREIDWFRSRYPGLAPAMYLSYELFFLGCSLLIQSPLMLGSLVVFCLSSHWIILAEEQWCLKQFGGTYQAYLQSVRRYL